MIRRYGLALAAVWIFAAGALWSLAFRGGWWLVAYLTWLLSIGVVAWPRPDR